MTKVRLAVTIIAVALLLVSCTHQRSIDARELHSDLTSMESAATETESFIDFVLQRRATGNYAEGHLSYLADEVQQTSRELHQGKATTSVESVRQHSAELADALANEIRSAASVTADPQALSSARRRIANIRDAIQAERKLL